MAAKSKSTPAAVKRLVGYLETHFWRLSDQTIEDIRVNIVNNVLIPGKNEKQAESLVQMWKDIIAYREQRKKEESEKAKRKVMTPEQMEKREMQLRKQMEALMAMKQKAAPKQQQQQQQE